MLCKQLPSITGSYMRKDNSDPISHTQKHFSSVFQNKKHKELKAAHVIQMGTGMNKSSTSLLHDMDHVKNEASDK
jgi:hypothetical protein